MLDLGARDVGFAGADWVAEDGADLVEMLDTGLDRHHQGTGLGLPLSAKLAALHEGTLTLESEPGKGTVARLVMPSYRSIRPRPVSLSHDQAPATDPGA